MESRLVEEVYMKEALRKRKDWTFVLYEPIDPWHFEMQLCPPAWTNGRIEQNSSTPL